MLARLANAIRLRQKADYDYRAARGTQHLVQLRLALSNLEARINERETKIREQQGRLKDLDKARANDLRTALVRYLVTERLTDIPGIGRELSRRVVAHCFRGNLRDLNRAGSVRGIGPNKRMSIMVWVNAQERAFPQLLNGDFGGKAAVLASYAARELEPKMTISAEQAALETERALLEHARSAISRLETVTVKHFRHALSSSGAKAAVPEWYFEGVYPAWDPMPDWFRDLLQDYGG